MLAALMLGAACLLLLSHQAASENATSRIARQVRTSVLTVGAILESDDEVREIAVKRAIEQANRFLADKQDGITLAHDIRKVAPGDNYQATRDACALLEKGVVAIVGPAAPAASEQVRSVCEYHTMPYIATAWNYRTQRRVHYSVNLSPRYDTYGNALLDFIKSQDSWGQFALVYENADSQCRYYAGASPADLGCLG